MDYKSGPYDLGDIGASMRDTAMSDLCYFYFILFILHLFTINLQIECLQI